MIPGSGRSPGEGIGYPLQDSWASLVAQLVKNPPAVQEDLSLIPGLGRSPREENGYPLQYSCLYTIFEYNKNTGVGSHSLLSKRAGASLIAHLVKNLPAMQETPV